MTAVRTCIRAIALATSLGVAAGTAATADISSGHEGFTTEAIVLKDGAIMAYYVKKAPGPTLVLVPGTLGDRRRFFDSNLVDKLDPSLAVVVVESRGQGRSWPPPTAETCSIEQYADDVMEIVHHLDLHSWYIGGHSLGGMIAIEIAGRRPEELHGVVTLEGWPHYTVEAEAFPPKDKHLDLNGVKNWREVHRETQRWTVAEQQRLVSIWKEWTPGKSILAGTRYPVLTIWGDRNMKTRPGRKVLGLPDSRNVEVKWVPGSDHYGLVSAQFSGEIATFINEFIAKVENEGQPAASP